MIRLMMALCVTALLTAASLSRPADDKKSDGEVSVPAGKEFKLSKDDITLAKEPGEDGRYPVTVKAAAAPVAVKMKAQKVMLGFTPAAKKEHVEVESVQETGALQHMRSAAKLTKEVGEWTADAGDVITHVNGYAVKTLEEVICALNAAEDPADIQIIIKDVNDGKQYAFYVTAVKKVAKI